MISAAVFTVGIASVLLVGFVLGACVAYWCIIHYCRKDPQAFAAFVGTALTVIAERCGRSHLHFLDAAGSPVVLPVGSVSSALQVEIATWLDHHYRGLS